MRFGGGIKDWGVTEMTDTLEAAAPRSRPLPGHWIGAGWAIVKGDLGSFVLMAIVVLGLSAVASVTVLGSVVVGGPLLAGLFIAVRRRLLTGRSEWMDVFQGFNHFLDAFLLCLVASVFSSIGLVLCFFPFFIVGAAYLFAYPFLIDRKLGFWEAMESSRRLITRDLSGYVIFFILLCLLNLVGLVMAGIGLLFTLPVSVAAVAAAYEDVVGFHKEAQQPAGPIIIP
jgi:uncharacterized membrane protein